jgi:hypothetical protein
MTAPRVLFFFERANAVLEKQNPTRANTGRSGRQVTQLEYPHNFSVLERAVITFRLSLVCGY